MRATFAAVVVTTLALAFTARAASAATFESLYSFCTERSCKDGGRPSHKLARDASGALYGVAPARGAHNGGTVFKLYQTTDNKWEARVLYSFCTLPRCADGLAPATSLIVDKDGNLYGVASHSGPHMSGSVFTLTHNMPQDTWTMSTVYNFCAARTLCADGSDPLGGLTYAGAARGAPYDGVSPLYGTTKHSGQRHGGTAYALTPHGHEWSLRVLHAFCLTPGVGRPICVGGVEPFAVPILDDAGNLYGTTMAGGRNRRGLVYKLTPTAGTGQWTETVLHDFCSAANCADGSKPESDLVMNAAGDLFGTTREGGNIQAPCTILGCGVLYKIASGGAYSVLHVFCSAPSCSDGSVPVNFGGLALDSSGNLYGTTEAGGMRFNHGIVFKFDGHALTTVHVFCSRANCVDGMKPTGGLVLDASGNLYGAAPFGGKSAAWGTVYRLTP
jgi:uncharacterized repeat protein (TIGR03803 family)